MRLYMKICTFILLFCCAAFAQQARVYQVKAAFIHKFMMYVDVPLPISKTDPVVIGIIGKGKSSEDFKAYFKTQKIKEHPVKVVEIVTFNMINSCHILFIEDESKFSFKEISTVIQSRPIVTIGDQPEMSKYGTVFSLYIVNSKTKFRINNNRAKAQGLKISSFLLDMAEIVE